MSYSTQQPNEDDVEANLAFASRENGEGSSTGVSVTNGGNSGHITFRGAQNIDAGKSNGLDEYGKLDHFIATHDHERRPGAEDGSKSSREKRQWWKFWKSFPNDSDLESDVKELVQVPEDWLDTDITVGLSPAQVEERRKRVGWNELVAEHHNKFFQFLGYFKGPILYTMEFVLFLTIGLEAWVDFGVVAAILALNALVGFFQEKRAADVVAALKGDIAMRATVVRTNGTQQILARELVPGDVVIVQEGQTVPGDCRLVCEVSKLLDFEQYKALRKEEKFGDSDPTLKRKSTNDLGEKSGENGKEHPEEEDDRVSIHYGPPLIACDQSAITGESLAVDKYMGDIAHYTTGCKRGKAYAIITASAKNTFVGKTADLVQGAKDQGHFKTVMTSIGASLLVIAMLFILVGWVTGFFHHLKLTTPDNTNLLHITMVLLIIAVPVGLPVVTTTTLAVGGAYLAKQKAIVQKLTAIESLAGVDVLCSDKTGTLTANKLSIRDPFVADGQDVNWMMAVAALASSHNIETLDPIDKVTILTLKRYPKAREILRQGWRTVKFTPFDPVSKRITTECVLGNDMYICAKGAPRAILALTNCDDETRKLYLSKTKEFAQRGFRALGVAYKQNNEDWTLLGLLSMFDPPREDTIQTIIEAAHLGVPVKMLTGDAIAIAKETCKMLGLGTKVYNSEKLMHSGFTGPVQHDLIQRADGFAEVFPEHKYQVVEMLQQRGSLTAMTGDGVNDAPSLKKADCGIAVEGSSEAAQAAADIVFLSPGLSTIILAIKTSRQIFQRMKAYIEYRIVLCLHLLVYLVTSVIVLKETIDNNLIAFIALFADLATVTVAYDNAHVEPRPVEWQLKKIWVISTVLGLLMALGTWIVRASLLLPDGGIVQSYASSQEVICLNVILMQSWLILVTRGGRTLPEWRLLGAILCVDILASLFALLGIFAKPGGQAPPTSPLDQFHNSADGRTDLKTVVVVWLYSGFYMIFIAVVYFVLNRISWINNLGRKDRRKKDTKIENVIGYLNKLALEHERDTPDGHGRYFLVEKAAAEEDEL